MRYAFALVVAVAMFGVSAANFGAQARPLAAQDVVVGRPVLAKMERQRVVAVWKQLLAVYSAEVSQVRSRQQQQRENQEALAEYGRWGPDLMEAAHKYGQDPASLYRVMICESKGDPSADNGVCKGLFQFNPATWAGTPYGSQSIFDGHAQIMAAAWMFSQGRKSEWTCQ